MKKTLFILTLALLSLSAAAKEVQISIVPRPEKVTLLKGEFKATGAPVNCDPAFNDTARKAVAAFASQLSMTSGRSSSYAATPGVERAVADGKGKGFYFLKDASLGEEAYTIEVGKKALVVRASSHFGVLYAIQTLKQLLPPAIYGKTPKQAHWFIPCLSIQDAPRFGYRGMHLDCSRHFFSVAEVKRYLDIMAAYKMNRFHWHLTDDQGWRIEIKRFPLLTEIGSVRTGTQIGKDRNSNDGIPYGGFYTQDQIREVIAYAASLGIEIIPEIDLPGHMLGALAAYPELGCTGGPYEVWRRWGISPQVLCPGKETTFDFLEGVLAEVAELFPSEYIHIGGDECPKTEWQKCPECQALIAALGIKATEEFTAEQFLQNYVTARVQTFLAGKGKKIIGWDEILEGQLAPGATVMSWRGVDGGVKAANNGFDAIMTPTTYLYFDYYQSQDKEKSPLAIGGYLPLEKVYSFEPFEGIDASARKHILGVQANLWTEYIASDEYLEYMLLPRMFALSEIQWCTPENRDYDRFLGDVVNHQFQVLDNYGYNYCREILGDPSL